MNSQYFVFHAVNKPKIPVTILINKQTIDKVKYVKYLGVLIDSRLSLKFHIYELKKQYSGEYVSYSNFITM